MSVMPDWWDRLTRLGKVVLVGTTLCTLWSVGIALFHPEATIIHIRNAAIVLGVIWAIILIIARQEIANSRLSDTEYFIQKFE